MDGQSLKGQRSGWNVCDFIDIALHRDPEKSIRMPEYKGKLVLAFTELKCKVVIIVKLAPVALNVGGE